MSFARVVPDEDGFEPTGYQNPAGPFVADEVRERQRLIAESIASAEERRVALELGLPVPGGES